jgi:DNA polymerase-3 subunit gamma/tau
MPTNDVFYQKFRPKHLSHILGQKIAVKILQKSCEKETFHHSYLLSGKIGTGKTSVARLLAAMLTCENRKPGSSVVCHNCAGCRAAYGGGSSDIQEIDAASNSGVDNIRGIIDGSRYSPQELKRRVFIIDECHMLTTVAVKSLLKTLEEPSSTAVFILATTEFNKIPPDVRSRCMKLFFHEVPVQAVSEFIGKLFASKKIKIDKEALDCIARASRGSVRDALEIAQEVILLSDGEVTERAVSELVGMAGTEELYSLAMAISDKDILKSFDILATIFSSNVDCKTVLTELGEIFRSIMLSKVSKKFIENLVTSQQEIIKSVEDKFTVQGLASMLSIFEDSEKAFGVNINGRWVLEAAVVKIIGNID